MHATHRKRARGVGLAGGERRQSGMALLLTLGFLCVLLMLVLSLAVSSRGDRRAASAAADAVRGRLVAESALGEALVRLRTEYTDARYPADRFVQPGTGSAWAGRQVLGSRDAGGGKAGLEDALSVALAGRTFTPGQAVADAAGWTPMFSTQFAHTPSGTVSREVVVGRYSYVVIDESGKIDPGAVVKQGIPESEPYPVSGASVPELTIQNLGFSDADRFCPESEDDVVSGAMPTQEGRWFSMRHLAKALQMTQEEMDLAVKTLFPFSSDREQFWRDRNNNGVYDPGEEADRLDVRGFAELSRIYHTFVGPVKDWNHRDDNGQLNAGHDDCEWLKKLDDNAWFRTWKDQAFAGVSEPARTYRARSLVAAQVAANIVDYADPDSEPTRAYLDAQGQIHLGSDGGTFNVLGVERNWALSQIAMRIEAEVQEEEVPNDDPIASTDPQYDVPFTIVGGAVVPSVPFSASVTILGAQLSLHEYEGGPLKWWCPVTANLAVGNDTLSPWGNIDDSASDIQDFNYPKTYRVPANYPANTPIVANGKFWNHPGEWVQKKVNGKWVWVYEYDTSVWYCFRSLQSNVLTDGHVKVLRNNDPVPDIGTTSDVQQEVAYYLQDYVADGKISLQSNQAIYLFETRTPTQGHRDYQDLVVLVTLRRAEETQQREVLKTSFTVSGMVNINPNNSPDMEFYLTKPDGSQIWRDDLLESRSKLMYPNGCAENQSLTAPAVHIRIRPKGNANRNYFVVDGKEFDLQNGRVYDFVGNMQVCLYNDKYKTNGAAMGHWWLGIAGNGADKVTILENGQTYGEWVTEEVTTPGDIIPGDPDDPTSEPPTTTTVNTLRVRAGFQVELSFPWAENAQTLCPPQAVEVTYTYEIGTATGQTASRTATTIVPVDQAAAHDGGTVMWTGAFAMGAWAPIEDAFDLGSTPPLDSYTVNLVRIDRVVVKDFLGGIADSVPSDAEVLYETVGTEVSRGSQVFHVGLTPLDPFLKHRGFRAADFGMFWEVHPEGGGLALGVENAPEGMGEVDVYYQSGPYAGIDVRNSLIQRLGDVGRVHSYIPNRSLRLWAATTADEAGHDAHILDVFKIGPQAQVRGRVNINSLQPDVLRALFTDSLDVTVDPAVAEILSRRANGQVFNSLGDFFGGVSQLTPGSGTNDAVGEQAVTRLAERVTVRPNYFTVIVCAQAVKDVAGVPYKNADGDTVSARYGQFDVDRNGRYVDPVLAEQKLMAVVYRDSLTNEMRIERMELLDD